MSTKENSTTSDPDAPSFGPLPCCGNQDSNKSRQIVSKLPIYFFLESIFFEDWCGRVHFGFLVLFLLSTIGLFSLCIAEEAFIYNEQTIMCVDSQIEYKLIVGFVVIGSVGLALIIFVIGMCCRCRWRAHAGMCLNMSFCLSVIVFPLFALLVGTSMPSNNHILIKNSMANDFYHCETDPGQILAYQVFFSANLPNQTCEFWPIGQLCPKNIRPPYGLPSLVNQSGILGAYHCQTSVPDGIQLCSYYSTLFYQLSIAELACTASTPLIISLLVWFCYDADSERYLDCCHRLLCCGRLPCSCSKEHQPLLE